MAGKLILTATPIGNLGDMSPRAVETLAGADLIAAEDTRNTIKLLNHFGIRTPLTSYHEFNKIDKAYELIDLMKEGKNVALVTDAGMPAISDPGEDIVRLCYEAGITAEIVPGPCAAVSALALSGLGTRRFVFEGFLPQDKKEQESVLEDLRRETRTIILYEAPHRLKKTAQILTGVLGKDRKVSLVRELTKIHEEVLHMTLEQIEDIEPRGEYVLVIEGADPSGWTRKDAEDWLKMPAAEHVAMYEKSGMSRKDAMKQAAADRGVTRREIYRECLNAFGKDENECDEDR